MSMVRFFVMAVAVILVGLGGLFWLQTAPANIADTGLSSVEKQAVLDREVPGWLQQFDVPSASVSYIEDGKIAWSKAYGEQSAGVAADVGTLYNIASMTKPITAEVIAMLATENALALEDPMHAYWVDPDIADDDRHVSLTPKMALRHRTGFPNWRYQTNDKLAFVHEPGTQTAYSGEGFAYVATYSSRLTDTPFETLAQEHVFAPANAQETAFTRRDWFENRIALPYRDGEFGRPVIRDTYNAADDVYSTARDYASFLLLVMQRSTEPTDVARLRFDVSNSETPFFCKIRGSICPLADGYGLGWRVIQYETQSIALHGGSDWGEQTLALMRPAQKDGYVILTNGANGRKVIREISETLLPDTQFTSYARHTVF